MFVSAGDAQISFDGYRIILPCISVGNVGQLTADLLINTLKMPRVGYLDDKSLLPLVGNDAFDHTRPAGYMHTSAEVYSSADTKTAVVQIRAPVAKGCKRSFCTKLLSWIKKENFSEVVVLTSSYAHERRDVQIRGEPYRFLLNPLLSELYSHFTEALSWSSLEPRDPTVSHDSPATSGVLDESRIFLPGSGQAKTLLSGSCSAGVRMVMLIAFCSQGDNIQDAVSMATHVDSWLKIRPQKELSSSRDERSWIRPSSWSLMYGGPSPDNIF